MDIESNSSHLELDETNNNIHHLAEKCYAFSIILIVIGLIFATAITYNILDIFISAETPIDYEIISNQSVYHNIR